MFQLIAGPCVIESEEQVLSIAAELKAITEELGIPFTFKASFDKANRTSIQGFRGPGIEEGLRILQKVKDTYGLPICTDIHEASLTLQQQVREVYLETATMDPSLQVVDCSTEEGTMATPEVIFSRIMTLLNPLLDLSKNDAQ